VDDLAGENVVRAEERPVAAPQREARLDRTDDREPRLEPGTADAFAEAGIAARVER
jgi:hypothetical protein